MIFLKSLKMVKKDRAQVALEYFIIFAVIVAVTLTTWETFVKNVRGHGEGFFTTAAKRIIGGE